MIIIVKIPAKIIPPCAYIPVLIHAKELTLQKPIFFLIDTGAYKSVISAIDICNYIDLSKLTKDSKYIYGIGGSQESYLLHDVILYFLANTYKWIEGKKFKTLTVIPFAYNVKLNLRLNLPSVIGLDIIGTSFSLYYGKNQAFLESLENNKR